MKQYLDLLKLIRKEGEGRDDRTGVGTIGIFGHQMRFNLEHGFPLVTTKKVHWKAIVHELLWFISGSTNIKYLQENGIFIWDEWADDEGNLGPVYGQQWRSCRDESGSIIDQLNSAIETIKHNPNSRRIIVSSWNVSLINKMRLPPCHILFQFYVQGDKISCQLYQRSADVFLGMPFNIASYALLLTMVAHITGLKAHEFIYSLGDTHIYLNHISQVDLQITREPLALPIVRLNPDVKNIDDFKFEDIELINYQSHPMIRGDVAV